MKATSDNFLKLMNGLSADAIIDAMYAISPAMAIYFSAGSALKYLDRAGLKDNEGQDLRKAKECWHMAKRMMVRKAVEDGKY